MVPWTISVMYGYGLYRSSARNINGWVFSEGLRGLTALSVASWSVLVSCFFWPARPTPSAS